MTVRDELGILKEATEKAIQGGFLTDENLTITSVDYTLDPASIRITRTPLHASDNNDIYLTPLAPLIDPDWALGFWGKKLKGDAFFGYLPEWQYHQFHLLQFNQHKDWDSFINYIALFL